MTGLLLKNNNKFTMKYLIILYSIFLISCGGASTCEPKNCEVSCPENQIPCPKNPDKCYDTTVDYIVDPCTCVMDTCEKK